MVEFESLTFISVFLFGILSFLSPCIIPLVPVYISYVAGISVQDIKSGKFNRWQIVWKVLLFIIGFSTVFTILGAIVGSLGGFLHDFRGVLTYFAGFFIALMGLMVINPYRVFDKLPKFFSFTPDIVKIGATGVFAPLLMGTVLAVIWLPCIGPVLASVLTAAALADSATLATQYLAVYSIGLGVPFLIIALFVDKLINAIPGSVVPKIRIVLGVLMLLFGIAIMTGVFRVISEYFVKLQYLFYY